MAASTESSSGLTEGGRSGNDTVGNQAVHPSGQAGSGAAPPPAGEAERGPELQSHACLCPGGFRQDDPSCTVDPDQPDPPSQPHGSPSKRLKTTPPSYGKIVIAALTNDTVRYWREFDILARFLRILAFALGSGWLGFYPLPILNILVPQVAHTP